MSGAKDGLAGRAGSALTDDQKIAKAIELMERLERECLVPDFAHDALGSCPLCRLITELKAPNAQGSATGANNEGDKQHE